MAWLLALRSGTVRDAVTTIRDRKQYARAVGPRERGQCYHTN